MGLTIDTQMAVLGMFDAGLLRVTDEGVIETSRAPGRAGKRDVWIPKTIGMVHGIATIGFSWERRLYRVTALMVSTLWRERKLISTELSAIPRDGDPTNFRPDNIDLVSRSELTKVHLAAAKAAGRERKPLPKIISDGEAARIRKEYQESFITLKELASRYRVGVDTIRRAIKGV